MLSDVVGSGASVTELETWSVQVDRPLEPCPRCGGLLSSLHLEAADAGWLDACCHGCGVMLVA